MNNLRIVIGGLIVFLVALSGCAQVEKYFPNLGNGQIDPINLEDALVSLRALSLEDIDAAMADATVHKDVEAMACWPILSQYIKSHQGQKFEPKGAASSYQRARDLRRQADAGISTELRMGCAPMLQESAQFLINVGKIARP